VLTCHASRRTCITVRVRGRSGHSSRSRRPDEEKQNSGLLCLHLVFVSLRLPPSARGRDDFHHYRTLSLPAERSQRLGICGSRRTRMAALQEYPLAGMYGELRKAVERLMLLATATNECREQWRWHCCLTPGGFCIPMYGPLAAACATFEETKPSCRVDTQPLSDFNKAAVLLGLGAVASL